MPQGKEDLERFVSWPKLAITVFICWFNIIFSERGLVSLSVRRTPDSVFWARVTEDDIGSLGGRSGGSLDTQGCYVNGRDPETH